MSRIELRVSFSEKDEAKRLGARWDPTHKVWFVSKQSDLVQFRRWFPPPPDCDIRARSFGVAESSKPCWKCARTTRVYAIALPQSHSTREIIEIGEEDVEFWMVQDDPSFVSYLNAVIEPQAAMLREHAPLYFLDFSKTTGSSYWMNHCEHCGMKQGDFEIHSEPAGAFFPMDERAAAKIVYHDATGPFRGNGDTGYGSFLALTIVPAKK